MGYNDGSPHFLLIGHEGSHNRGCEALVRTTVSILREEFPESYVTVASMYPEHDVPLLDIERLQVIPGVCRIPDLYQTGIPIEAQPVSPTYRPLLFRLAKAALPYGLVTAIRKRRSQVVAPGPSRPRPTTEDGFRQVRHLKQTMLAADAVISIGGDLFIEDYGPPIYFLESVEYAQFLGRKTIVWGASIWLLKTHWVEDRVKAMLQRCDLVTVRDEPSLKYISKLGVTTRVVLVADGAFLMPPKLSDRARVSWPSRPKSVVGFNGSTLVSYYLPRSRSQRVVAAIVRFLQDIIDSQGSGVVLVPHDAHPGATERDFLFEIMQAIDRPDWVYMPPIGLDARETKALIGQCDLFIGMRFHPTIASLSQSIPTLGLSHSPKFAGLHQEVYGHTDYLIPYEDVSLDALTAEFETLQAEQDNIRKKLASRVPELQAAARRSGQYVRALLA